MKRKLDRDDFERMALPEPLWEVQRDRIPPGVAGRVGRYLDGLANVRKTGFGLILFGPPGVGKSGIAALVLKEAKALGYSCYLITPWTLRECVKSKILWDDGVSVLDRCLAVDFFVLDSLKLEDATGHFFDHRDIAELLLHRKAKGRPSIVTTSVVPGEIMQKFPYLREMHGRLLPLVVESAPFEDMETMKKLLKWEG